MGKETNLIYKTYDFVTSVDHLATPTTHPLYSRTSIVTNSQGESDEGAALLSEEQTQISEEKFATQHLFDNKMVMSCRELVDLREYMLYGKIELSLFNSTDVKDTIFKSLIPFNPKERNTIFNILLCCRRWRIMACPEGDYQERAIYACHDIYCTCNKCVQTRVSRAEERLHNLGITSKRIYHYTIGSNMMTKEEIQNSIIKYMRVMRYPSKKSGALAYKLNYIKVFDIGRGSYHNTGKYYLHFHIALVGEKVPIKAFLARSKYVLKKINSKLNIWGIGWRPKNSLLHYFAKRMAGQLGERKGSGFYYYPDVMSLKEYFKIYYNRRVLTWSSPQGFFIVTVPTHQIRQCPFHKMPLIPAGFEDVEQDYPPADP